jgi:AcrR family transcriptional regulator
MTTTGTARRRQARGERRIEQILDAAAAVFAEVGYERATTNGIAGKAGISPGSLYQFFPNKEAIAAALADRYASGLRALDAALDRAEALPLDALIDGVVDPIVAFNVANPGFKVLLADPAVPERVSAASRQLGEALVDRVESLIGASAPRATSAERQRSTVVTVQLFKALLPVIVASSARDRAAYVRELKRALRGYLEALERH